MADISKIKTRSNGTEYNIKDASAFRTGDTAETALADGDYIPFYDASASGKRKTLWSNIKSVLKTYFDTLYTKTVANPTGTATATLTKLGIGSDIYSIEGGGGGHGDTLVLTKSSVSSLPTTITNSNITADMVCIKSELSNPSAQIADWTVTTSAGSLTVSGTISGTTDIKIYLMNSR